jgi:hypothetical protein
MPWLNVDRVSIRFSEHVILLQQDLLLTGVNTAAYAVKSFGYDPATFTGTWALSGAVGLDKLPLQPPAGAVGDPLDNLVPAWSRGVLSGFSVNRPAAQVRGVWEGSPSQPSSQRFSAPRANRDLC